MASPSCASLVRQEKGNVLLPAPSRVNDLADLADLVAARMRRVAKVVQKTEEGCVEVRFELTPTWRLRPDEIDAAIEEVNLHLPAEERVSRAWLLAQKGKGDSVWDAAEIEERFEAITPEGPPFLLMALAAQLWHGGDAPTVYTDDSALYGMKGDTPGYLAPTLTKPDEAGRQVGGPMDSSPSRIQGWSSYEGAPRPVVPSLIHPS